jgi:hypothetical protein
MKSKEFTWQGEKDRLLQVCRPCPCGCDDRGGRPGVGYLTGSDEEGNGFTIWIESKKFSSGWKGCWPWNRGGKR